MTNEHQPEKIFRDLRRSCSAERDSEALWQRIEARLEPQPAGIGSRLTQLLAAANRRPVMRLAAALIVVTVLAVSLWRSPNDVGELASIAAMPSPPVGVPAGSAWELDVRLVRGFDGAPPSDVRTEAIDGAGGASRLADLRADLGALVQFDDFGLVGEWTGGLGDGRKDIQLSASRSLAFEIAGVDDDAGSLQLRNIWLDGAERFKVASEMTLTPGVPHLIGVRPGVDVDVASLFLAIGVRSRPAPETNRGAGEPE